MTENVKSEHVPSNRPIHIGTTPDTTQTGPSCRVERSRCELCICFVFFLFYTVVMLLTFILIISSIPSPIHSSIPGLKFSFSANPSHRSIPFLLRD